MKHAFITYLMMAMVGLVLASCSTNNDNGHSRTADEKSIVIVFEGDTHCETGGYSRFAGLTTSSPSAIMNSTMVATTWKDFLNSWAFL